MSYETIAKQVQFAIHPVVADHMPSQLNMPTSRKPVVFHMTFGGGKWKEIQQNDFGDTDVVALVIACE